MAAISNGWVADVLFILIPALRWFASKISWQGQSRLARHASCRRLLVVERDAGARSEGQQIVRSLGGGSRRADARENLSDGNLKRLVWIAAAAFM
jgi:hypothetical protein